MTIIGLDPGFTGGICIIKDGTPEVYRMPIKIVNGKNQYDIPILLNILEKYIKDKPDIAIENVHTMPGQGLSSSGALLEGKGILIGVCYALFKTAPKMIHPPSWKKSFPQLTETDELDIIKNELKTLKTKLKNANDKSLKKEINKLHAKYKSMVKTRTRELAASMYPNIADEFKLIRDDGKADALFIALHACI